MEKVQEFMRLGMSPTAAIKAALKSSDDGRTPLKVGDFVAKYNLPRARTSNSLNGGAAPTQKIITALATELGGTDYEWRHLLWALGEPTPPAEPKTLVEVLANE